VSVREQKVNQLVAEHNLPAEIVGRCVDEAGIVNADMLGIALQTKNLTQEGMAVMDLSEAEVASILRFAEKRKKAIPLPPFQIKHDKETSGQKVILGGEGLSREQSAAMVAALSDLTGTAHHDLAKKLVFSTVSTFPGAEHNMITALMVTMGALAEIAPRDGLEGLLASQMASCHNLSLNLMKRAAMAQNMEYLSTCLNQANKLMRTFTAQVEALKKYRSKGEQKVVVEHVHVNAGGQAIVGAVTQGGGGTHGKNGN
jgi:hypothetical protein